MAINKTSGVDEKAFEQCGFPIPYKHMWIVKKGSSDFHQWHVCFDPLGKGDAVELGLCKLEVGFNTVKGAKCWISKLQERWKRNGIYEKEIEGLARWEAYGLNN